MCSTENNEWISTSEKRAPENVVIKILFHYKDEEKEHSLHRMYESFCILKGEELHLGYEKIKYPEKENGVIVDYWKLASTTEIINKFHDIYIQDLYDKQNEEIHQLGVKISLLEKELEEQKGGK